ncbi:cold-shock protein [Curtobacterium sp. ISL-83]|uniref:cold-shock protein n=1 Tax=Curtobacterium sp. ISL-83 TaxID=2819145 RepID=UPI001BE50136|nr:cold shock domain-containing protein [Curtobacterium sp. ISL-83]MBT2503772.1 cold shock domain-containing protein [Curtobacterium sp. ISL-83]
MQRVQGVCVRWSDDDGWGVLRSDGVDSEVFAHFSELNVTGFHALLAGDRVQFDVEPFPSGQDGYFYRAHNITPM